MALSYINTSLSRVLNSNKIEETADERIEYSTRHGHATYKYVNIQLVPSSWNYMMLKLEPYSILQVCRIGQRYALSESIRMKRALMKCSSGLWAGLSMLTRPSTFI